MSKDVYTNLIIPGAGKSGTSSLHYYLSQHPEICMSTLKEPHYFTNNDKYGKVEDYNTLFTDKNKKYKGEASTTYFISELAAKRIKNDCNNPKFIFLLRDPLTRIESHYNWLRSLGEEKRYPMEAIMEEKGEFSFKEDLINNTGFTHYINFSNYYKALSIYLNYFNKKDILVITTEDLKSKPVETLNICFDFLGVSQLKNISLEKKNKTITLSKYNEPKYVKIGKKIIPQNIRGIINKHTQVKSKIVKKNTTEILPFKFNDTQISQVLGVLKNDLIKFKDLNMIDVSGWKTYNYI